MCNHASQNAVIDAATHPGAKLNTRNRQAQTVLTAGATTRRDPHGWPRSKLNPTRSNHGRYG
jgi:hypothetical protein